MEGIGRSMLAPLSLRLPSEVNVLITHIRLDGMTKLVSLFTLRFKWLCVCHYIVYNMLLFCQ